MKYKHFVLVKHNRQYFRAVIAVSYGDRKISLGSMNGEGMAFSLEEATILANKLRIYGYEALVWSRKEN